MQKKVEDFLKTFPGYLKKSPAKVAMKCNLEVNYETLSVIKEVMKKERFLNKMKEENFSKRNTIFTNDTFTKLKRNEVVFKEEDFKDIKEKSTGIYIETVSETIKKLIKHDHYEILNRAAEILFKDTTINNVLVIGDIHEPFCAHFQYLLFVVLDILQY